MTWYVNSVRARPKAFIDTIPAAEWLAQGGEEASRELFVASLALPLCLGTGVRVRREVRVGLDTLRGERYYVFEGEEAGPVGAYVVTCQPQLLVNAVPGA